jgi:membrane protein YqaA with SNARE-associated domain
MNLGLFQVASEAGFIHVSFSTPYWLLLYYAALCIPYGNTYTYFLKMEMNLVVISKHNFVHKATEEKKLFSAN